MNGITASCTFFLCKEWFSGIMDSFKPTHPQYPWWKMECLLPFYVKLQLTLIKYRIHGNINHKQVSMLYHCQKKEWFADIKILLLCIKVRHSIFKPMPSHTKYPLSILLHECGDTNKNYCSLELVICKTASHSQCYRAQWYQDLLVDEACHQSTAQHFDEDTLEHQCFH